MAKKRSLKKRSPKKMKGGMYDGEWNTDDWSQYLPPPPPLYSKDMGFTPGEYSLYSPPKDEPRFPQLDFTTDMLFDRNLLKTMVNDLVEVNATIQLDNMTLNCEAKFTITDPGYDGALRIVCGKINNSSFLFVATADEKTAGQSLDNKDTQLSNLWPGTVMVQWIIEFFVNPSIANAAISAAAIEATNVVALCFRETVFNQETGELTFGTEMSEIPDGVASYIKGLVTEARNASTDDDQTGGVSIAKTLMGVLGLGAAASASGPSPDFDGVGIGPAQVANIGPAQVANIGPMNTTDALYKNYPLPEGASGLSLPTIDAASLLPQQSSLGVTPKSLDALAPLPDLSWYNIPGQISQRWSPPERVTIQKFSNDLQKVTYEAMTKYGIPGENLQQVYDNAVQACIAKVTPEAVSISIIDPDTCSSLLQEGKKQAELKQFTKDKDNTAAISEIFFTKNDPSSNLRANAPAAALGEELGFPRMKRNRPYLWGDAKHREGSPELEVLKKLQEIAKDPTLKAYKEKEGFIKKAFGNDMNALNEYAAIVGRESDEARQVRAYDLLGNIQKSLAPLLRVYDDSTVGKAIKASPEMFGKEVSDVAAGIQKDILDFSETTGLTSKEVSKSGAVHYFDNKHVNSEKAINARKALRLEGLYEEANADFDNEMWVQNLFRNTIGGLVSLAGLGLLIATKKHINEVGETEKRDAGQIELKKLNMKLLKVQKVLDNLKINTWEMIKTKNLNKYAEQIELDHFKQAWNDIINKRELPLIFDKKDQPTTITVDQAVKLIRIRMKTIGWFTRNIGAELGVKGSSQSGFKFFDKSKKVEFGTGKGTGGSRRRLLSGKRRATRGGKKAKVNRTKKHPRQKKRRTNTRRKRS